MDVFQRAWNAIKEAAPVIYLPGVGIPEAVLMNAHFASAANTTLVGEAVAAQEGSPTPSLDALAAELDVDAGRLHDVLRDLCSLPIDQQVKRAVASQQANSWRHA